MNYKKIYYALVFVVGTIFLPVVSFASEKDIRAQCFVTLKENMREAKIFSEPLKGLQEMSYGGLEPKFSINYKNLASFGLELDKGILEMRLYSFGRQTGYIHPLDLPIPSSTKSDKWKEPAKEFIVAEEFVVDPEGKKHFLNCAFFSIGSDNLLNVTRENYLYDGEMTSLTKVAKDASYKAWYSENISFDYNDKPFVDWERLFIYPKLTQNEYFNRYDIAEVFPANMVESFDVLKFFLADMTQVQVYDDSGVAAIGYVVKNKNGDFVRAEPPKELAVRATSGPDEFNTGFPLANYYQTIENRFPKFAERLALRGAIKWSTFKKLSAIKESDPEAAKLLEALMSYRSLAVYDADKKNKEKDGVKVSDPEKDKLLQDINVADTVAGQFLNNNTEAQRILENKSSWLNSWVTRTLIVVSLAILVLIGVFFRKNKNQ